MRKAVAAFVVLALLGVLQPFALPAAANPPFTANLNIHQDSATKGGPTIVLDSAGDAFAVYSWDSRVVQCTKVGTTLYLSARTVSPPTQTIGPSATIDASNRIHVVWMEGTTGVYDLYYSHSTTQCTGWTAPVKVNTIGGTYEPRIAVSGDGTNVYVVFQGDPDGNFRNDIYFTRSTNGGASFEAERKINLDTGGAQHALGAIAVRGTNVYVAWYDERETSSPTNSDIYLQRSTNSGTSFLGETRVNDNTNGAAAFPSIAVTIGPLGTVYVAWHEYRGTSYDLYFASSSDGSSFGTNVRVNDVAGSSSFWTNGVGIAVSASGRIHVAWAEHREGAVCGAIPCSDVYYGNSTTGGASFSTNVRVNDDAIGANQRNPSLALHTDGRLHVAWRDDRNGNWDAYYSSLAPPDEVAPTSQVNSQPVYRTIAVFIVDATASDSGGSGLAQVELFYRPAAGSWTSYGVDSAAPWSWSFDTAVTGGDGLYDFYTVARDNERNTETPPVGPDASTTVDTAAPSSSVDPLPAYSPVTVALTATAGDVTSGVQAVELFYRRGTTGGYTSYGVDSSAPWSWAFDASSLGDGVYQFYTVATDSAGNAESAPALRDAETTVDTQTPSSSVNALPTYQTLSMFTVNAVANDATSGISQVELWSRRQGGPWNMFGIDTAAPWSWSFDATATGGEGVYEFQTIARDNAGNVEAAPASRDAQTTVDWTAPTVAISEPLPGATVGSASILVSGVAADLVGVALVEIRVGGGSWQTASGTTSWALSVTLTPGANTLQARATDLAGNPSQIASVTLTYDADRPVVSIQAPAEGALLAVSQATVTGTASDAYGVNEVKVRLNGGPWITATGTTSWSVDLTLTAGTNVIDAQSFDVAANPSTIDQVSVTVDLEPPSVLITSPANEASVTTSTVTVTGTATDNIGVATVEYRVNGGAWTLTSGTASWSFDATLRPGENTIEVRATDLAGHPSPIASLTVRTGTAPIAENPWLIVVAVLLVAILLAILALISRRRNKGAPGTTPLVGRAREPPPPPTDRVIRGFHKCDACNNDVRDGTARCPVCGNPQEGR